jgi:hypothetical protein
MRGPRPRSVTGRFPSCILQRIKPPATFPLTANIGVLDPILGERDATQQPKHALEIDRFENPTVKVDGEFGSIRFEKRRGNGKDRNASIHSLERGRNAVRLRFIFADGSSRFTAIHDRHSVGVARRVSIQLRRNLE